MLTRRRLLTNYDLSTQREERGEATRASVVREVWSQFEVVVEERPSTAASSAEPESSPQDSSMPAQPTAPPKFNYKPHPAEPTTISTAAWTYIKSYFTTTIAPTQEEREGSEGSGGSTVAGEKSDGGEGGETGEETSKTTANVEPGQTNVDSENSTPKVEESTSSSRSSMMTSSHQQASDGETAGPSQMPTAVYGTHTTATTLTGMHTETSLMVETGSTDASDTTNFPTERDTSMMTESGSEQTKATEESDHNLHQSTAQSLDGMERESTEPSQTPIDTEKSTGQSDTDTTVYPRVRTTSETSENTSGQSTESKSENKEGEQTTTRSIETPGRSTQESSTDRLDPTSVKFDETTSTETHTPLSTKAEETTESPTTLQSDPFSTVNKSLEVTCDYSRCKCPGNRGLALKFGEVRVTGITLRRNSTGHWILSGSNDSQQYAVGANERLTAYCTVGDVLTGCDSPIVHMGTYVAGAISCTPGSFKIAFDTNGASCDSKSVRICSGGKFYCERDSKKEEFSLAVVECIL